MNSNRGYASEKFWKALVDICHSEERVQDKMLRAYVYNLIHVQENQVSSNVWEFLKELHEAFSRHEEENEGEGTAAASARHMTSSEARALLDRFLETQAIVFGNND